jgi:predicted HTH domain antitoxin
MKRYKPEQIVTLLRQIEVQIANGKTTPQACKETVNVELRSALLRAASLEASNLSQEAGRLLALELYREDKFSLGRAAELCEMPLAAFMDFVAKHGVPPPALKI